MRLSDKPGTGSFTSPPVAGAVRLARVTDTPTGPIRASRPVHGSADVRSRPTPFLLVDGERLSANVAAMAAMAQRRGLARRPHAVALGTAAGMLSGRGAG